MSENPKNIFIGAAWPYANGSLHLGHVSSLIGGDLLARYHRSRGDQVLYVSGSDCHGTPIALEAEKQNTTPDVVSMKYHAEFENTLLNLLGFSYDKYSRTSADDHKVVVWELFTRLLEGGYLEARDQDLAYCDTDQRFLADRYVEGTCPNCKEEGARGDQCDHCGKVLDARELVDPKCKICGNEPIWKSSEHFLLQLPKLQDRIFKWLNQVSGWRKNAVNFVKNIVSEGLRERAITRDSTWGVKVPVEGWDEKVIYVWFEAVCGYLSASKKWAEELGKPDAWKDFWQNDQSLHYYVHGKDNIPFHAIIWPGILMSLGDMHLPDRIFSSEYLTFGNRQLSKSRGEVIKVDEIIANHGQDAVRYFLVMNGPENSDSDFNWEDFQARVNGELIGKLGNLANRSLKFVAKNWPAGLQASVGDEQLQKDAQEAFSAVGAALEAGEFRTGLREVINFSEVCNRYFDAQEPWKVFKVDADKAAGQMATTLWLVHCSAQLSHPFLPNFAGKVMEQLQLKPEYTWAVPTPGAYVAGTVEPIIARVELEEKSSG